MTAPGYPNDASDFSECPSGSTLQEFAQLQLPAMLSEQIGNHVRQCPACQNSLDRFTDSQLISEDLRRSLGAGNDPGIPRLIQELCDEAGVSTGLASQTATPIQFSPVSVPQRNSIGTLQHFQVRRELGSGATAIVFEAVDTRSGTPVALKFIRSSDAATLRRVEREARAISQIQHDHVVSILAAEVAEDGRLFLVMPLVSGKSLSELISSDPPPTHEQVCSIVMQVAEALTEVHRLRLLHRDVKPSNILVDADGVARLTDFGLASFLDEDSTLTESGVLLGTPCYMSPEQASGIQEIDFRTDIYSLGATLYECLTGTKPYRGAAADVIRQVLRQDPVPPRQINPQVPQDLETICLTAMRREPRRRYASAQAMHDDLDRWLARKEIAAKRMSRIEQCWLWVQRNPLVSLLLLALSASIVVGLTGMIWNWRQALHQRDIARENMRQTMRAVEQFYVKISQPSAPLNQPGLQPFRRELMLQAVEFYQEILKTWPDDSSLKTDLANASLSLANLTEMVGSADETVAAWEQAAKAVRILTVEFPQEQKWKDHLYGCYFHQANVHLQSEKTEEAVSAFTSVRGIVKSLHEQYPAELRYRRDFASCTASLGNCLLRLNRLDEAAVQYREAAGIFRQLHQEDASNGDVTQKLAVTLTNLAMCLNPSEQLPVYREARETLRSVKEEPMSAMLARRLAKVDLGEGDAAQALGQTTEAIAAWTAGMELLKPHVEANPAVHDFRNLLGSFYFLLGTHVPSRDEAISWLQLAKQHQEMLCQADPGSPEFQANLKKTLELLEQRSR